MYIMEIIIVKTELILLRKKSKKCHLHLPFVIIDIVAYKKEINRICIF